MSATQQIKPMKLLKPITAAVLIAAYLAAPLAALAADSKDAKNPEKAKPYTLKTCPVSGEKLGGDMVDLYVFTYQGREIILCCEDCKKDVVNSTNTYNTEIEGGYKVAHIYFLTRP